MPSKRCDYGPARTLVAWSKATKGTSKLWLFGKNFFKHPNMVGWVLPSSPFLVNEVLEAVPWPRARVLVEYGPGVGTFTHEVLRRMRSDATLIALEINDEFFDYLRQSVRDPRLRLVRESATQIDAVLARLGLEGADCIISGIPFKTIPETTREVIVRKTYSVLRPQGRFLVYQFSPAVLPCLERAFGKVTHRFEWLNILPARVYHCVRRSDPINL